MNRATFLKHIKMGAAGVLFSPYALFKNHPNLLNALLGKVGLQLFSAPKLLAQDFEQEALLLHEMGFTTLETFGPYAFSSEKAKRSFQAMAKNFGGLKSGFYQNDPITFKHRLGTLEVPSMHTDLDTLENNLGPMAKAAQTVGAKYVVLPMIPNEFRKDLDAYKKMADRFNAIGKACQKEGLRFAYHNHGFGFAAQDGSIPFHHLMKHTDPETVFLEMDIFWTTAAGQDPSQLLAQYPNRYKLMHLKDMTPTDQKIDDQKGMRSLFPFFRNVTSCGSGIIDLETIIPKALNAGVEHFFVEHDFAPNPKINLRSSANYLLGKTSKTKTGI